MNYGNGRVEKGTKQYMKFWSEHASYPFKSHDLWFVTEDIRWGKFDGGSFSYDGRVTSDMVVYDPSTGEIKQRKEMPYPNAAGALATFTARDASGNTATATSSTASPPSSTA